MSDGFLTYRGAVYPWHCDHMGHMNVMWYVGKFDEATWNFFSEVGLTRAFMDANDRGMAAVEQVINYKKELMAGDTVTVHSAVVEIEGQGAALQPRDAQHAKRRGRGDHAPDDGFPRHGPLAKPARSPPTSATQILAMSKADKVVHWLSRSKD